MSSPLSESVLSSPVFVEQDSYIVKSTEESSESLLFMNCPDPRSIPSFSHDESEEDVNQESSMFYKVLNSMHKEKKLMVYFLKSVYLLKYH